MASGEGKKGDEKQKGAKQDAGRKGKGKEEGKFNILLRPGLSEFLSQLSQHF